MKLILIFLIMVLVTLQSDARKKRGLINGLYGCSTILGVLLASFGVTLLSLQGSIETSWRILYWIGGITGGVGLLMRLYTEEEIITPKEHVPTFPLLWKYRVPFIVIVMTSGLSYANYYMLTSLLNGYLPLVSTISTPQAMEAQSKCEPCATHLRARLQAGGGTQSRA